MHRITLFSFCARLPVPPDLFCAEFTRICFASSVNTHTWTRREYYQLLCRMATSVGHSLKVDSILVNQRFSGVRILLSGGLSARCRYLTAYINNFKKTKQERLRKSRPEMFSQPVSAHITIYLAQAAHTQPVSPLPAVPPCSGSHSLPMYVKQFPFHFSNKQNLKTNLLD